MNSPPPNALPLEVACPANRLTMHQPVKIHQNRTIRGAVTDDSTIFLGPFFKGVEGGSFVALCSQS